MERLVEMVEYDEDRGKRGIGKYTSLKGGYDGDTSKALTGRADTGRAYVPRKPVTKAWVGPVGQPLVAGTVLDPFCGTGTTGAVALRMGRSFIGIDLYAEFCDIAAERCEGVFKTMEERGLDPWALEE
jgi:hypothetical protein